MGRQKNKKKEASSPFEDALDEAETLQQRAERRGGVQLYASAAQSFQRALEIGQSTTPEPEWDRLNDCRCLLGEVQQVWAEEILRTCERLPESELTVAKEEEARVAASGLFEAAVRNYQSVRDESKKEGAEHMRLDALVNCGNTLSSWGELIASSLSDQERNQTRLLFQNAEACYAAAIDKEEDCSTWNNLGDSLIQQAEFEAGEGDAAHVFYRAMQAYEKACALSSSENGDNLPALLCDWGAGLLAFANTVEDVEFCQKLLVEAQKRLHQAISFDRASNAPFNALGDVYVAMYENCIKVSDHNRAIEYLSKAYDEGYNASLRIQVTNVDALIGTAEVMAEKSKVERAQLKFDDASSSLEQAVAMYEKAICNSIFKGSLRARSDVHYNLACCYALLGQSERAVAMLNKILNWETIQVKDILGDQDLQNVHPYFSR
eukprot:jgi/Picsp_1/1409/NSC_04888-R1_hypothetical protein COCSUDRAFT_61299 [Coccomyxa subellipsoidea C-169]